MTAQFETWKSELLHVGNIVQDDDHSVPPEESERRFNRYIEMLGSLTGTEGYEYALAIMESVQAKNDYGAYQTAGRAAWRFGEDAYCRALLQELPRLVMTLPDWAGDFVVSIANGHGTAHQSTIHTFNRYLCNADPISKLLIDKFIANEEIDGWLSHCTGIMGSNA